LQTYRKKRAQVLGEKKTGWMKKKTGWTEKKVGRKKI
jgi:hypothetical protein